MNQDPDCGSGSEITVPITIALTEEERRAAAHLLNALVGDAGDRGRELTTLARDKGQSVSNEERLSVSYEERSALAERARKTYVNRARRSQLLNCAMFGEAAWDMLLALYVTDLSGARHTVSGVINLSGVPQTTALRWLDFLDKEQLVARKPSPQDRRVFFIELTNKARELLDTYFSGIASEDL